MTDTSEEGPFEFTTRHIAQAVTALVAANEAPLAATSQPEAGSIIFQAHDGSQTMLLRPDGEIFIRGEKVDNNREVYEAMCKLLRVTPSGPTSERPMAIFDAGPHARDENLDWLTKSGGG